MYRLSPVSSHSTSFRIIHRPYPHHAIPRIPTFQPLPSNSPLNVLPPPKHNPQTPKIPTIQTPPQRRQCDRLPNSTTILRQACMHYTRQHNPLLHPPFPHPPQPSLQHKEEEKLTRIPPNPQPPTNKNNPQPLRIQRHTLRPQQTRNRCIRIFALTLIMRFESDIDGCHAVVLLHQSILR